MAARTGSVHVYDGDGDSLMVKDRQDVCERITLIPDAMPSKVPMRGPHIRIMWGQHLVEDVLRGRYGSLVCAVNGRDNSRGIISQLATLLPSSQWDEKTITEYAAGFSTSGGRVKVLKIDMDLVEVLAILRPAESHCLTVDHLSH